MEHRRISGAANASMRLASLLGKLGLSLFMGKYLTLADMGLYGLIFGVVMTSTVFLGFRLDYITSRELVRADPLPLLCKLRDQSLFYFANYIVALLVFCCLNVYGVINLTPSMTLYACALIVFESYANLLFVSLNAMERQVTASTIFFVRSGAWVFVVMLLGFFDASYRNAESILQAWIIGCVLSIILTFWVWRQLPWKAIHAIPINWQWVMVSVRKCIWIWLGAVGLSVGAYLDRFVVNTYLGLEQVGIATFYFSFTNAILTVVQSGVLAFTSTRLVAYYRHHEHENFWKETHHAIKQIIITATVVAIGVGVFVPLLGKWLHRPGFVEQSFTLWLMLGGVWLRSLAEAFYYVLFARHQDRAIWLGNLLFLVPAFGCNIVLVPLLGLSGIGYGAIISSVALLAWRFVSVSRFKEAEK